MPLLLVHGAGHDENCWNALLPELKKYGLETHTLTLRGHGSNKKNAYTVSMKTYAEDVCNKALEIGKPCVLVGHSMGGAVISAAGENQPRLFKQMIYLAAFALPKTPTRLAGYSKLLAKLCQNYTSSKRQINILKGTAKYDAKTSISMFYSHYQGDVNGLVARNICPQPIRPFLSALQWSDERLGNIPKDYIECTQDYALPIETQRAMQKNMVFQRIETLESDHSPFASMPQQLADIIVNLTQQPD